MTFNPALATIRFGTGLSPRIPAPVSVEGMIAALTGADHAAAEHPIPLFADVSPSIAEFRALNRARRATDGSEIAAETGMEAARLEARDLQLATFGATLARWVTTGDGIRERLVAFWADHFTLRSKNGFTPHLVTPYVEEAIRPHVTGRFADMLRATTTHPMMLAYLDQSDSMGPNSEAAERRDRGLNENLARELLELHTVGIGGPYDQNDVRELAELLTGLAWDLDGEGTVFRADHAEPGAETVMGQTFSAEAGMETIHAALDALATHPATAAYIAMKFARHFVDDDPPADLVAVLEAAFRETGGDLLALTRALLDHPAAWRPARVKVRPPFAYVAAGLRALDVPADLIRQTDLRESRRLYQNPLSVMGQPWEVPPGPDGWPDVAPAWITPQFMAGRIDWAMRIPVRLMPDLPDPRDFAVTALAVPPDEVIWAASAAEDRATGIAVTLASAAFQRR